MARRAKLLAERPEPTLICVWEAIACLPRSATSAAECDKKKDWILLLGGKSVEAYYLGNLGLLLALLQFVEARSQQDVRLHLLRIKCLMTLDRHTHKVMQRIQALSRSNIYSHKSYMWPVCTKPVLRRILNVLSMMHHLKEKHVLFTMTHKLSFYLNPNWNNQYKTTCMCGTSLWQKSIKSIIYRFITCLKCS